MATTKLPADAHGLDVAEVIQQLQSDQSVGLSSTDAKERTGIYGLNSIAADKGRSIILMILSQFRSPMVWILLFATGLSFYFQEIPDAIAILVVIVINALIGFYMEFQAERSMNSLKKLATLRAKVLRNGKLDDISADEIVPGDIVYIEAGDMVPADGRLFKSTQLQLDESALTGESLPVMKQPDKINADAVLAERNNMLYKGTFSTAGNGYAIVTATGMQSEFGKIVRMVQTAEQSVTPLEKKLELFTRKLIWITVGLVMIVFVAGLLNGHKVIEMLETSIALAVAAIPEGLPIVATMALAQGMMRMARHNVIVKKLSAIETLGGTNVICTDKTGTLTQNKIEVSNVIAVADNTEAYEIMHHIAVLCNTAELTDNNGKLNEVGDPLETGLLKYVVGKGIDIGEIRKAYPKIHEEPFSSETKVMATLHQTGSHFTLYAKGAVEELLKRCDLILEKHATAKLDSAKSAVWLKKAEEFADSGLKVIAGAYKSNTDSGDAIPEHLVFVGLFALIDPPREEVSAAVQECKTAGIKVIMITGDHPATAKNIALTLGIADKDNCRIMLGKEMQNFEDLDRSEKTKWLNTNIFARVTPKQKLDLISVLQEAKNVVGMTGDGVNDAPALKKADIGIAMGLRGTQVSQEAADMVLKDDSFSSIIIAIKQGRIIFDNIRKFVVYLLSCNLSELLIIASAAVFNLHFQLFALQILFINLITDVLPALALAVTSGGEDVMKRPPAKMNEPIIGRRHWLAIFFYSIVIAATAIGAVFWSHYTVHRIEIWNADVCTNILFFTLIFSQLLHVFNISDGRSKLFRSAIWRNKYVWYAILLSLIILFGMYAMEPTRNVLSLQRMTLNDWIITVAASVSSFVIIYAAKKFKIVR